MHVIDNLQFTCQPCNLRKSARSPVVFARLLGIRLNKRQITACQLAGLEVPEDMISLPQPRRGRRLASPKHGTIEPSISAALDR